MSDAIVLLSGGIDSATALAMTRATGRRCHALSFATDSAMSSSSAMHATVINRFPAMEPT